MSERHITVDLPDLYDWQRKAWDQINRHDHAILVISRQAGKTELGRQISIESVLDGLRVLWVSPTYAQSLEIYRSIFSTMSALVTHHQNGKELSFVTGGRMWFRSSDNPDSLRSLGYHVVLSDEHAFGSEEVWPIVEPTLIRRKGKFIAITTPAGMSNHCYDLWEKAITSPHWYTLQLPWHCCPDIPPEKIDEARLNLTPTKFASEYLASFEQAIGSLFPATWVDPKTIYVDQLPESPQRTMLAIDSATGRDINKGDYSAIVRVEVHDNVLYADVFAERLPIPQMCQKAVEMYVKRPCQGVACEVNGFQVLVRSELERQLPLGTTIYPIENTVDKRTRISRLAHWLSRGTLKIVRSPGGELLRRQLADFGSDECKHDDAADALEMAIRKITET